LLPQVDDELRKPAASMCRAERANYPDAAPMPQEVKR
jgi:hypothetical protein